MFFCNSWRSLTLSIVKVLDYLFNHCLQITNTCHNRWVLSNKKTLNHDIIIEATQHKSTILAFQNETNMLMTFYSSIILKKFSHSWMKSTTFRVSFSFEKCQFTLQKQLYISHYCTVPGHRYLICLSMFHYISLPNCPVYFTKRVIQISAFLCVFGSQVCLCIIR